MSTTTVETKTSPRTPARADRLSNTKKKSGPLVPPLKDPPSPGTHLEVKQKEGDSTPSTSPIPSPRDVGSLPDDPSVLKEEIKKLDQQVIVNRRVRESYKNQKVMFKNEIEVKEKELHELKTKLEEAQGSVESVATLTQQISEKEKSISEKEGHITKLKQDILKLEESVQNNTQLITTLKLEKENQDAEISRFKVQLKELGTALEQEQKEKKIHKFTKCKKKRQKSRK